MSNLIARFVKDESGATAIEYGLIAALIGVAMAASAQTVGDKIKAAFDYVSAHLTTPAA